MKFIWLFLLALIIYQPMLVIAEPPAADDHEFHISKCLINYDEQDKALQVSMHIFIDDLEEALRRQGFDQLYIGTEKEVEKADIYIENYLKARFKLRVNGQEAAVQYLGKEASEDYLGMWCYLEVSSVTELHKLLIINEVLMEIFDDQKNVINITGPGKEGVLLLQKGRTRGEVAFK